jgi:hypothetical protein
MRPLQHALVEYLTLRRALGYKLKRAEQQLDSACSDGPSSQGDNPQMFWGFVTRAGAHFALHPQA